MGQVAQTDGVEPEHVVQSVVQTGGDQQTVQEGVDAGADAVHASDAVADCDQSVEDDGPDEQQNHGHQNGDQTGSDCNEALAGEECQPVRQLGILELVVAGSADDGSQNADKGVAGDLLVCNVGSGTLFDVAHSADHTGVQQLLHHQEADQTGQTCGTIVVSKADSGTDGKQPCHVIDQSAACLDEQEADGVCCAGSCALGTHNSGSQSVADAHQDAADRQHSDGKHQSFAQFLEILHHKTHSSLKNVCVYRRLWLQAVHSSVTE